VTQGAGVHHVANTRWPNLLILWNNRQQPGMRYRFAEVQPVWNLKKRFSSEEGTGPRFKVIVPETEEWQLVGDYWGLARIKVESSG
jgi:hypothetical protein